MKSLNIIKGLIIIKEKVGLELITDDILFLEPEELFITDSSIVNTELVIDMKDRIPKNMDLKSSFRELILVNLLINYFQEKVEYDDFRLGGEDITFIKFYCRSPKLTSSIFPIIDKEKSLDIGRYKTQEIGASLNIIDTDSGKSKYYVKVLLLQDSGISHGNIVNLCLNHFIFHDIGIYNCMSFKLTEALK